MSFVVEAYHRRLCAALQKARSSAVLMGILGTGIRSGVNLALIPLVLIKLSSAELALWWVFVALGNFANLADFGFGSTIPRVYNYLLAGAEDFEAEGLRIAASGAGPNFEGINRVNASVRLLYLRVSLVAILLLAIGGTIFLAKPIAESGLGAKVWWIWGAFGISIGCNLAASHWLLAVQGLDRMRDLQLVYVLSGTTYAACAAALLLFNFGLTSMVVATFAKVIVMRFRCRQIFNKVVPKPEVKSPADRHILAKLWPNAYKFGVIGVATYCLSNGIVLICSQFLGKDITASYGLTVQIGNFMISFASLWLAVKWPQITMLRTQERLQEMAILFGRRLLLVVASFVVLATGLLLFGNALLAWKGTQTRLLATPYLVLYLVYALLQIFYAQFGSLAFTENVVPFFKIGLVVGVGVIVTSLILTRLYGLWGLLCAPLLVESMYSWYVVRRGFQGQPLTPRQFAFAAVRGYV